LSIDWTEVDKQFRDYATAGARLLRVAFVPTVIFRVAVVFLSVLLFFIWLISKEDIAGD
jgi:hypothetical protein